MKAIKILAIIIIVLGIIFGIKIVTNNNNIENKKELTLQEIKEIIAKSENINNYIVKYEENGKKIIRKYNNGKETVEDDQIKFYIDYEKNEATSLTKEKKAIIIENNLFKESMKTKIEMLNQLLESEDYIYKGEEEYKGTKCLVIEINQEYAEQGDSWLYSQLGEQKINTNIWIDKEKGVLRKIIGTSNESNIQIEYEYEFNCVTEEEVEVPDLSEYEVINTITKDY